MATTIKQGDAYALPVAIIWNNAAINPADIETVEFCLGDSFRKLYPDEVTFSEDDGNFYIPMTQEETLAFEADSVLDLDARVKFVGGDVFGVKKMGVVVVMNAISEEVI